MRRIQSGQRSHYGALGVSGAAEQEYGSDGRDDGRAVEKRGIGFHRDLAFVELMHVICGGTQSGSRDVHDHYATVLMGGLNDRLKHPRDQRWNDR